MANGHERVQSIEGTANGTLSSFDFDGICQMLDPSDTPTKLWHKIIDRVARVILFYQVDYEFIKPRISRCIRLAVGFTRERHNEVINKRTVVKPTVFLNDRELPVSFIESVLHEDYLKSADELTDLITAVEAEPMDDNWHEAESANNSRSELDPAAAKLHAILRRTKNNANRPIAVKVRGTLGEENFLTQRRKNSRRAKELSCAQQTAMDEPLLPQMSDEDNDDLYGTAPKPTVDKPASKSRADPISPSKRQYGEVERDSSVIRSTISDGKRKLAPPTEKHARSSRPSVIKRTRKESTSEDSEEQEPEGSPTYSKEDSPELYGPVSTKKKLERYGWSAPGQGKVALHKGNNVYVHHVTLRALLKRCDTTKPTEWPKYAGLLLEHLVGGWDKYLKDKTGPGATFGIDDVFGDDFCQALVGHVDHVFQAMIPKNFLVDTLNAKIADCRANPHRTTARSRNV